jgi:hypothetical protein
MYHLAPMSARESIAKVGLDFRSTSAKPAGLAFQIIAKRGNYLWDNYAAVVRYQKFWGGRAMDLYKVSVSGLKLERDPLEVEGAYLTTERIKVERLVRVELT